ncbi:MAG: hypothetical protein HYY37_02785 [Candidatus Aenigmarchaeota archaeon]|nr:hypothetical protein [Candidatus Aenigmarchaeota archaeon]
MPKQQDEKLKKLEDDLKELERRIEGEISDTRRRVKDDMQQLEASFRTFRDVMKKIYEEKKELEKDRDFLLEKHKELLRKLPLQVAAGVQEKLVAPVQQAIQEQADFITVAAKGGDEAQKETTPIDELFAYVAKNGKVRVNEAAKKFNVHEVRIEEWAKILEEHGLIEVHYPPFGKAELRKARIETAAAK